LVSPTSFAKLRGAVVRSHNSLRRWAPGLVDEVASAKSRSGISSYG